MLYCIYYIYTRLLVAKDVCLRISGPMSTGNRHHRSGRRSERRPRPRQSIIYIYNRDRWSVFSLLKILSEINARQSLYNIFLRCECIVRRHLQRQWQIAKSIAYDIPSSCRSGSWRWLWCVGRGHLTLFSVIALRNYTATMVSYFSTLSRPMYEFRTIYTLQFVGIMKLFT